MMKTGPILLIDGNFIAHRTFYSSGRRGQNETGIIFGFCRDILTLIDRFIPSNVCMCFDYGKSIREKSYPEYKANRRNKKRTDDEIEARKRFDQDVDTLMFVLLKRLGFKNIFHFNGFEADDVIARLVQILPNELVIVSADQDLYQLLDPNTVMYNPRSNETINHKKFKSKYGIHVNGWPLVKAIAGCTTDNITGVKGVGEITAIKYLNGQLTNKETCNRIRNSQELINSNLELVKLPHAECPTTIRVVKQPEFNEQEWREVLEDYYTGYLKSIME